jgi:hypothetical protein
MGIVLLVIGLAVVGFGLLQHFKGKRLLSAPFLRTGQVATLVTSPDPKGLISTEGEIQAEPVLSPCSKTPCLYYEVEITRKFEKQELTQNGTQTKKGSHRVETLKKGTTFVIDDGSGPIPVNGTEGGDFDNLQKSFSKEFKVGGMSYSEVQFGELRLVPQGGEGRTVAYEAVEKIVPAQGKLFVLGKLENGTIGKPGWRSMLFSGKGREGLLKTTHRNRAIGLGGGGVAVLAAIPLMIFGPAPKSDRCPGELTGGVESCKGRITSKSGDRFKWQVAEAGEYTLEVTPPAGLKFPLYSRVTVQDAAGATVAERTGGGGATVVRAHFEPGAYRLQVRESSGIEVAGGFDYSLRIVAPGAPAAVPPADEAPAVAQHEDAELEEVKPATVAAPAPATVKKASSKQPSSKKLAPTRKAPARNTAAAGPTP